MSLSQNNPQHREEEEHITFNRHQGGQSRCQHDWVHGFPEPVKSFITFVVLSQISCGKVQTTLMFFCTRLGQSFSSVCFSFLDYHDQLKKKRKILCDWVHTSVGRSNLENCIANARHKKNIKDPQKRYHLGTVSKIFYWRA